MALIVQLYGGMCDSFDLFVLEDRSPDSIIHVIFDLDPISYRKFKPNTIRLYDPGPTKFDRKSAGKA